MFPGVDGFAWDAAHIVFLGAFFAILCVISAALVRAALQPPPVEPEKLRWRADFLELSPAVRKCRHELAGQIDSRQCPNHFDCRVCDRHPYIVQEYGAPRPSPSAVEINGLRYSLDRFYHRGHTWARLEPDGTYTIGPDELARAAVGLADSIQLPPPGLKLCVGGTAWTARKGADEIRVLSPIDGEVLDTNGAYGEWRLRVKPSPGFETSHLLAGEEVVAWLRASPAANADPQALREAIFLEP